jgi:hypothetical protein
MDPITAAIVAALVSGVAGIGSGVAEVGKQAIVESYQSCKNLIKKKFGPSSDLAHAVDGLEAKPDSAGRKEILKEEVAAVKADQDPEIRQVAQQLLEQIGKQPGGQQHLQQAIGNYIAQAEQGSNASVNVSGVQGK